MKHFITMIIILLSYTASAQINNEHLNIGDQAPEIIAVDQKGLEINSTEILKNNRILLVFYRGNWCPYCRKHLGSLQEHLNEFIEKGIYVVVVTPENVERTKQTAERLHINFSIVHDTDNKIMNDYKVAFKVNEKNVPNYYNIVSRNVAEYNVKNNNVLPVPATYIIDKNDKISYVQYDPDYKNRSDFSEIMKIL